MKLCLESLFPEPVVFAITVMQNVQDQKGQSRICFISSQMDGCQDWLDS